MPPFGATILVPIQDDRNKGLKMRKVARSSGKSYRHINGLPDNVLLEIFESYQTRCSYGFSEWQRLAHVCQRWRYIIFASPRRLDLTLLCTYGTPVKKNLGCWLPFPIVVDYFIWNGTGRAPNYEDDVTAALEHPDRMRSIKLHVTSSLLGRLASMMQEPFLALTDLWLSSEDQNVPVLPVAFLGGSAPQLRRICLEAISFPALPTLLLSASDLVHLRLENIPQGGYVSPDAMVAGLAASTRLDTLWIWFKSPASRLELRCSPPLTRNVLPSLITFNFRGSGEYLEHILARIDTPRLHCFEITYFNQLDFQVPQLSQFIGRMENLELAQSKHAQVRFHSNNVHIELDCEENEHPRSRLTLRISCKWLDWQVSHLARILGQSPVLVSSVNHLSIDEDELQPGWQDDMDNADWPELLRPFTSLKTLHGSQKLGRHIALALDDISGEMVTEILPALGFLLLQDQPVKSVARFIAVRRLSGHPVTFVNQTPLLPRDVLIDGFVARTFTHEDANNYFMLLLRTPPSQYFLEYYGIVYDQGAWHITHNVNSVQGASPDVPLQTTPLLDHSIGETYGTVVPQLRWTPAHEVDVGHIEEAVLQLPIFFVNHNGSIGFGLSDILRGCDRDLHNASGFAPLGGKTTTHIRIKWPGYGPWSLQIATRDGTHARNPITLARFMKLVGISVDKFFRDCVLNIHVGTDSQWQIGIHGGIMQEEVKIVGVVQVSAGSWMPVMQLTRYVI